MKSRPPQHGLTPVSHPVGRPENGGCSTTGPHVDGDHRGCAIGAGGRGDRRGATTPAAAVVSGTGTRERGRRARRAARPEPPGERTRPAAPRHAGPAGGRVGAPERARQATADRAPRGGCSALRVGLLLPLVCYDRFGGLDMHGGNCLHWLVTARVNFQLGKLDPGDGFRPFQDEGRRRREAPSSPASKSIPTNVGPTV